MSKMQSMSKNSSKSKRILKTIFKLNHINVKLLPNFNSTHWRVAPRSESESLTLQNCKVLRIRSWKEARRARRPFGSLWTCRVTTQKLLNKRFALTYGRQTSRPLYTYIPVYTHTGVHARVYTHAYVPAYIRAEQRRYIGSNPAHSALMNMLEHGSSTLPTALLHPLQPRSISPRLHCIGKGVTDRRWDAGVG